MMRLDSIADLTQQRATGLSMPFVTPVWSPGSATT